jgi:hypothetical protein
MAHEIGYILSTLVAVGIIFIGARFLIVPHAAAAAYGVAVRPDPAADAFLSVKGIRDIASGLIVGAAILSRSVHLLGWIVLAASVIPTGDAAIVLRHGGTRLTAFGIHGATAVMMLVTAGLLLLT